MSAVSLSPGYDVSRHTVPPALFCMCLAWTCGGEDASGLSPSAVLKHQSLRCRRWPPNWLCYLVSGFGMCKPGDRRNVGSIPQVRDVGIPVENGMRLALGGIFLPRLSTVGSLHLSLKQPVLATLRGLQHCVLIPCQHASVP